MSRSGWAWTEAWALVGGAARDAGSASALGWREDHARLAQRRLWMAFSPTRWLLVCLSIVTVAVAAWPPAATARPRRHPGAQAARIAAGPARAHVHDLAARHARERAPLGGGSLGGGSLGGGSLGGGPLGGGPLGGKGAGVLLALGSGFGARDGSRVVRWLQRRLALLGLAAGPLDGLYGPLTEQAVERFQAAGGLRVDGIAGPATLAALRAPAVLDPGAGYERAQGSQAVRALQRRLAGLGLSPGPLDGRYGPLTTAAVRRLQFARGLPADGIVAAQTSRRLFAPAPRATTRRRPMPARPRPAARPANPGQAPVPVRARAPFTAAGRRSSSAPVTLLLLALAALGLLTIALSYRTTLERCQRAAAGIGPPELGPTSSRAPVGSLIGAGEERER